MQGQKKTKKVLHAEIGSVSKEIRRLQRAVAENWSPAEAIRALGPPLIKDMARDRRLHEELDQFFGGHALDFGKPLTSEDNLKRFRCYFGMLERIHRHESVLRREWFRIHGVNPDNPSEMLAIPASGQKIGAAQIPSEGLSQEDYKVLQIARMLRGDGHKGRDEQGSKAPGPRPPESEVQ